MEPIRPFSDLDWQLTPEPIRQYIVYLENRLSTVLKKLEQMEELEKRVEQLEKMKRKNSSNSSKPLSSDLPFSRPKLKKIKSKRKKGGQKGHKGHRQQMLSANKTENVMPQGCNCGLHQQKTVDPKNWTGC